MERTGAPKCRGDAPEKVLLKRRGRVGGRSCQVMVPVRPTAGIGLFGEKKGNAVRRRRRSQAGGALHKSLVGAPRPGEKCFPPRPCPAACPIAPSAESQRHRAADMNGSPPASFGRLVRYASSPRAARS